MAVHLRLLRPLLAAGVAVLAAAAPAAGQDPLPTPTPTATPAPAPVTGQLTVAARTGHRDGSRQLALRGDRVRVTGTLEPFVAGQKALVRVRHSGRTLLRRRVRIVQAPDGTGRFSVRLRLRRTGWASIQALHRPTPQLAAARARSARVLVVRPTLTFGARGSLVRVFQRRLRALRYAVAVTGVYDARTGRGVMAWRKVNHRPRLESADRRVVRAVLARRGAWKVRHPKAGRHVEADLSQQVLSLVKGDRVVRTYHTSSGAPATPTVIGKFRFYRKDLGTNALGMVDAAYFIRGYAIHGYHSVPPYPASHGCLRVPIPDARRIHDWIRLGDRIFVSA